MWMVWRSAQFCHGLRIDTLLTDFHKTKSVPWVSNSFSVFLQKLLERAFRIPRDQWSLSHQAWSPAMFRVDTHKPLSGWEANVSGAHLESNWQTANLQWSKKNYQLYVFDIPFNLCLVVAWSPRTSKRSHPHNWLLGHSSSQIAPQVSFTILAAPNIPGLILIKAVVKVLFLGRRDLHWSQRSKVQQHDGEQLGDKHSDVALLWRLAVIVGLMQVREPFGIMADNIVLQAPGWAVQ